MCKRVKGDNRFLSPRDLEQGYLTRLVLVCLSVENIPCRERQSPGGTWGVYRTVASTRTDRPATTKVGHLWRVEKRWSFPVVGAYCSERQRKPYNTLFYNSRVHEANDGRGYVGRLRTLPCNFATASHPGKGHNAHTYVVSV